MALATETRDIGGREFTCVQFGAMASYRLFARLGKVVGPAIQAMGGAKLADELEDTDLSEFAPALSALLENLASDPSLVVELLKQTSTEINGRNAYLTDEKRIDAAFEEGGLKSMLLALKLSLEVNFASFFAEGLGQFGQPQKSQESPSD